MSRNRTSAKKAGTTFETLIATYLNQHVDDRIERRRQGGTKDRGDIAGLRHMGGRIVVECKNVSHLALPEWTREAEIERRNDGALAGIVIHKRHGKSAPGEQWVSMTLDNFVALLTGNRDHIN